MSKFSLGAIMSNIEAWKEENKLDYKDLGELTGHNGGTWRRAILGENNPSLGLVVELVNSSSIGWDRILYGVNAAGKVKKSEAEQLWSFVRALESDVVKTKSEVKELKRKAGKSKTS